MAKSSDLRKEVKNWLSTKLLKQTLKNTTNNVWAYEDIKLSLYFEIAKTGNVFLISKTENHSYEECVEAWEQIVKYNSKVIGSYDYDSLFELECGYADILSRYQTIKATLFKLYVITEHNEIKEDIKWLKSQGYIISVVSSKKYAESLDAAYKKCSNLLTHLEMKQKALNSFHAEEEGSESAGLEELLAEVSFYLGFAIDNNVTLARFNEYHKLIKKKYSRKPLEDGRE